MSRSPLISWKCILCYKRTSRSSLQGDPSEAQVTWYLYVISKVPCAPGNAMLFFNLRQSTSIWWRAMPSKLCHNESSSLGRIKQSPVPFFSPRVPLSPSLALSVIQSCVLADTHLDVRNLGVLSIGATKQDRKNDPEEASISQHFVKIRSEMKNSPCSREALGCGTRT